MFNNAEGTGNALINDISRVAHEALHGGGGSADISGVIETSGILLTPIHSAEGSSQSVITDLDPSTNPLMTKGMFWINEAQDASGWSYVAPMDVSRSQHGVAALGGKLYAVGGWLPTMLPTTSVEVYDPSLVQMPQITHQGEDFYISHARGGPKTFIIPHPEHEGKMLRHACLEAPTRGTNVYEYQITTTEDNQTTEIALPSYFKHLNGRPRVYVYAGKGEGWKGGCGGYVNSDLTHAIIQTQKTGTFNIMVTGVRKDPQAIAYSVPENIDAPIALEDIPTK